MGPMLGKRSLVTLALVATAIAACGRKQEPATVTPPPPSNPPPTSSRDTAAERRAAEQRARDEAAARDRAAAEERARANATLRSTLEEMVFFDYDVATLRDDAKATLDRKVALLRSNPNIRLRVEGHADERGSVEYNLALSLRRANAIRDYLANFQLDANRFEVVPLGEERPLSTGTSESDYARNRRGEFHITAGLD
jgi:peptidoglycan-associated lipoprotein